MLALYASMSAMDECFMRVTWELNLPPSPFLVGDRMTWCKGTNSRQREICTAIQERFGQLRPITRSYGWLVRQPSNADPSVVAVYIGQHHVGFVPPVMAATFAPYLDALLAHLRLGDPMIGHASCLITLKTVRDGAWLVGLIGPWPPGESSDEFWLPDRQQDSEREVGNPVVVSDVSKEDVAKYRYKIEAINRVQKGMTLDELIAAIGQDPGKTSETVTKKCTKHVLHFVEDVMSNGRYLLRVTLEDGIVVSWVGERP